MHLSAELDCVFRLTWSTSIHTHSTNLVDTAVPCLETSGATCLPINPLFKSYPTSASPLIFLNAIPIPNSIRACPVFEFSPVNEHSTGSAADFNGDRQHRRERWGSIARSGRRDHFGCLRFVSEEFVTSADRGRVDPAILLRGEIARPTRRGQANRGSPVAVNPIQGVASGASGSRAVGGGGDGWLKNRTRRCNSERFSKNLWETWPTRSRRVMRQWTNDRSEYRSTSSHVRCEFQIESKKGRPCGGDAVSRHKRSGVLLHFRSFFPALKSYLRCGELGGRSRAPPETAWGPQYTQPPLDAMAFFMRPVTCCGVFARGVEHWENFGALNGGGPSDDARSHGSVQCTFGADSVRATVGL